MRPRDYARLLRQNQTKAERIFWNAVRDKKIDGFKFRREYPFPTFIVDFYCHEAKLIIEIDGGYHKYNEVAIRDSAKDKLLKENGYRVLRVTNQEIIEELDSCLEKLRVRLLDD